MITETLTVTTLKEKNILVLGAGVTGLSCLRFLAKHGIACTLNDNRPNAVDAKALREEFPNVSVVLGQWYKQGLAEADIVLVSPGIDLDAQGIKSLLAPNCLLMGDVELFCQLSKVPVLAVTGSNGKSTVVSLLAHLGKALGYQVALGGNIGVPVLDQLEQNLDYLILELSSFQLETLTSMKALGAAVLNISDDHLDRHHSMENYQAIKQRIYQQAATAVYNRDDALTKPEKSACSAKQMVSFGSDLPQQGQLGLKPCADDLWLMYGEQALIAMRSLPIAGLHNALNCLAAFALGKQAGWPLAKMAQAVTSFQGLAHRCQLVSQGNSIQWINDSKATNVGATLAALQGLLPTLASTNKIVLIAGGDGKGADFAPLAPLINQDNIVLITLGKDGHAIAKLSQRDKNTYAVDSMVDAVEQASQLAQAGDIVLLSPACASIDMFKNYLERGDKFVEAIEQLNSTATHQGVA